MNTILVIIAVGVGNGSGAAIEKIRYGSEEACQSSVTTIMNHRYKNIYGYVEAICIDNGDVRPK